MTIEFYFDDQLENTLIAIFKQGWTWQDYLSTTDILLTYPPNLALPHGTRVDLIMDFRLTTHLPTDGVGTVNVIKARDKKLQHTCGQIPREGGIIINVGNPIFISAMLRTFGVEMPPKLAKERIAPSLEKAREAIRQHRIEMRA